MIAKGFEDTATKAELRGVEERLDDVGLRLDGVDRMLNALGNEVHSIKVVLPPLARSVESSRPRCPTSRAA